MNAPMQTDLLLYDGDCRLCGASARTLRSWSKGTLKLRSFREGDVESEYQVSIQECEAAIHLVRADGRIEAGVRALLGAVRHRWFAPLMAWVRLPGIRWVADVVYGWVSRWRFRIAGKSCEGGCSIYR